MAEIEEYKVDKELCIDCNACYTTYPEIFKQIPWEGETKADVHAPTELGKYNPWDIVGVCPTDAIAKMGDMPEKPETDESDDALAPLEDLGPWEDRWERVKGKTNSKWEIMKRYGMAATVTEEDDQYTLCVEFPDEAPIHILTYQMGLPDHLPEYEREITLSEDKTQVTVSAILKDGHFKSLTGKINSFPDRFRRVFKLAEPVEIAREAYRSKVLTLVLKKLGEETKAA
jgi:ferredoxin/HSP20 family molecular chaperone IbpA